MKDFHLPLPKAIDSRLRQKLRKAKHAAIADYAAEMAGTHFDLDSHLESAGIKHLVKTARQQKLGVQQDCL